MPEVFQKGTLYLCPTPIGNLEDITYRTVRCLREADLIAAEDTRHTKQLLMAYDIDTPLTSYHEHNKAEKGPQLIEKLKDGLMIALVSDAACRLFVTPAAIWSVWRWPRICYRSLAGSQCRPYGAHCLGDGYDAVHLCRVFAENPEASTAGPALCGSL